MHSYYPSSPPKRRFRRNRGGHKVSALPLLLLVVLLLAGSLPARAANGSVPGIAATTSPAAGSPLTLSLTGDRHHVSDGLPTGAGVAGGTPTGSTGHVARQEAPRRVTPPSGKNR